MALRVRLCWSSIARCPKMDVPFTGKMEVHEYGGAERKRGLTRRP